MTSTERQITNDDTDKSGHNGCGSKIRASDDHKERGATVTHSHPEMLGSDRWDFEDVYNSKSIRNDRTDYHSVPGPPTSYVRVSGGKVPQVKKRSGRNTTESDHNAWQQRKKKKRSEVPD